MGVKVYYSEISGQKEVKKRQQRVMMILDSKLIPYEAIDITDPSRESEKEFMLKTAKTRGDVKYVVAPQIFNEEEYLGDFDDFELANENDELETFLKCPKAENNNVKVTNGTSRGSSAEADTKPANADAPPAENSVPVEESEPAPSSDDAPTSTPVADEAAPAPSATEESAATEAESAPAEAAEEEADE